MLAYPLSSRPTRISHLVSYHPTRLYSVAAYKYNEELEVEGLEEYAPSGFHPTVIGDSF